MTEDVRVIEQDYHRNGIGGAGFVVSLVEWTGTEAPSPLFVAVSFGSDRDTFVEQTAVLNTQLTAEGSIAFARGNSWRGSDRLGPAVADAWQASCLAQPFPYDPFAPDEPDAEPLAALDAARDDHAENMLRALWGDK